MTDTLSPWVAISSGDLTAEIDPQGAQLSSLRDRGDADLLWDGNAAVWAGRAPLLFPIVGALAGGHYRLGNRTYALSRHGFARGKSFVVTESALDHASFRLASDTATLAVYPFAFELDVEYRVRGRTLTITTRIGNPTSAPLPASFGYHPAFRWPLPFGEARAAHFLEFAAGETAPVRRLNGAGLLTPERHPTPVVGRRLSLADDLFTDDVLIFDALQSRSVTYGADRGPRLEVSFPDSPYLGVWTKPGANFICIEPWHGVADPQDFAGDFTAKPGVVSIEPDASLQAVMAITLLP